MRTISILIFLSMCLLGSAQEGLHTRNIQLPCLDKNFNLFIHLSVDSITRQPYLTNTDVQDLMTEVSGFFEPICLSVSACEINVLENYTFHNIVDERRLTELRVLWGKPRRLNVYILGNIPRASCGVSTYYGINKAGGNDIYLEMDSAECRSSLAGQLAHHLGHFLGLADTYNGDDIEIVDDPLCAIKNDSICDTPSDPFGAYAGNAGQYIISDILPELIPMSDFVINCEFVHALRDPQQVYYQPQVGNIMSAYPCKCGFTNGQFKLMANNYENSNHKPY